MSNTENDLDDIFAEESALDPDGLLSAPGRAVCLRCAIHCDGEGRTWIDARAVVSYLWHVTDMLEPERPGGPWRNAARRLAVEAGALEMVVRDTWGRHHPEQHERKRQR
jgi:hypothetical protein